MSVGFCVSGNGYLVEAILQAQKLGVIDCGRCEIFLDRESRLEPIARQLGVHVNKFDIKSEGSNEAAKMKMFSKITEMKVDVLFLTFNWLLPHFVLKHFNYSVFNLHMSLLPAFPGINATQKAINHRVKIAGVSFIQADQGIDTGTIISQGSLSVHPQFSKQTLGREQFKLAVPLGIQLMRMISKRHVQIKAGKVHMAYEILNFNSDKFSPNVDEDIIEFSNLFLKNMNN